MELEATSVSRWVSDLQGQVNSFFEEGTGVWIMTGSECS